MEDNSNIPCMVDCLDEFLASLKMSTIQKEVMHEGEMKEG
jgi:hypothetical protein